MISLFEIAINFYQGIVITYYADKFYEGKRNLKLAITFSLLSGVFLCIHQVCRLPIPDTLVFLFVYGYQHITKRSNLYGRLFCCLLITALWIGSATAFNSTLELFFNVNTSLIESTPNARILCLFSFNALITIEIFIICNLLRKNHQQRMPKSASLLFISLLIVEWITVELLFTFFTKNINLLEKPFFYGIFSIFFIIILSIVMYEYFCIILNRTVAAENRARILTDTQKHQDEIKKMYQAMLRNQHDFKHRLTIAEALLKQKKEIDTNTVKELLVNGNLPQITFMTGNESIDALLTLKKEIAETNNISFRYQPYPLYHLPIDEVSFFIIISNLLDNALQELQNIHEPSEERYISLKFSKNMDMFFISCSNPTLDSQKDLSQSFFNNCQSNGHGYGLESIKQTVESNQGIIQITSKNHLFNVDIILPMGENI